MISAVLLASLLTGAIPAQRERPAPARQIETARRLLESGKAAEAAVLFERVLSGSPGSPEALFGLGVARVQLGDPVAAIAALQRFVKLEPESADGHAVLGIVLLGQGRVGDAGRELERAVRLDPSNGEAAKALARVCNLQGKAPQAIALLRNIVISGPADDESRTLLGRALLKAGEPREAAALLEAMLAAGPDRAPEVYLLAAAASRDSGNAFRAMQVCELGMRVHPHSERIETLYVSLPRQAVADRTSARIERLEKDPNNVEELIAAGRIMTAADRTRAAGVIEAAEQLLARAVKIAPRDAAAWYHYGRNLRFQGRMEESIRAFRTALPLAGSDDLKVLILSRLGGAEARLEHMEAAENALREAFELCRNLKSPIPEAGFEYYSFLALNGRDGDGRRVLDQVLIWEPLFAPARLERAKLLAAEDKSEQAIEDALLVTGSAEDAELLRSAHYLLARAYRRLGREDAARKHQKWVEENTPAAGRR